jgi:putative Ca2+/H+ antiporter (TMEM165/GDT1 family)
MRLISFLVAGGGGRGVYVNPEQVVCLVDMGEDRTQLVTTGLSGSSSMSLVVEGGVEEIAHALQERLPLERPSFADDHERPSALS